MIDRVVQDLENMTGSEKRPAVWSDVTGTGKRLAVWSVVRFMDPVL